jgi:hypothetical protein
MYNSNRLKQLLRFSFEKHYVKNREGGCQPFPQNSESPKKAREPRKHASDSADSVIGRAGHANRFSFELFAELRKLALQIHHLILKMLKFAFELSDAVISGSKVALRGVAVSR